MKKYTIFLLAFALLLALAACGAAPESPGSAEGEYSFTDDLGRTVTLARPERVAALIGSYADVWCLAGVARSNILSAGVDAIVTFAPVALNAYSDFRIGSLANLTLERLAAPAAVTVLALIAAFSLTNELDVLTLGSETARSLGMNAGRRRIILLAVAAALTGSP